MWHWQCFETGWWCCGSSLLETQIPILYKHWLLSLADARTSHTWRGHQAGRFSSTCRKEIKQERAIQGCFSVSIFFWYLFQGEKSAWFSVLASNLLPVHVTTLSNADTIYEKHVTQELLKVRGGAGGSLWLQGGRTPVWGTTDREHPQVSGVWDLCSEWVEMSSVEQSCTDCMAEVC